MRVQEKNEVLSMSERRKFSSIEISGYLSLDVKNKLQKNFPGVAKRWVMLPMGGTYHPHPPHGYGTIVIGSDWSDLQKCLPTLLKAQHLF